MTWACNFFINFNYKLIIPEGNMFTVRVGGEDKVTVNSDGTLIVKPVSTLPTGTEGATALVEVTFSYIYKGNKF